MGAQGRLYFRVLKCIVNERLPFVRVWVVCFGLVSSPGDFINIGLLNSVSGELKLVVGCAAYLESKEVSSQPPFEIEAIYCNSPLRDYIYPGQWKRLCAIGLSTPPPIREINLQVKVY